MPDSDRQRQAAELLLLQSMYPSEFRWLTDPAPDLDQELEQESAEQPEQQRDLAFAIAVDSCYTLEFSLPRSYPAHARPAVVLSIASEEVSTGQRKRAREALRSVLDSLDAGSESVDVVVSGFCDALAALPSSTLPSDAVGREHTGASGDESTIPRPKITRAVIWAHHLLAPQKRRAIQRWSRELRLGGYVRAGYPGAVFVEGESADVAEFVGRLKGLRWQALQVRALVEVEDGKAEVEAGDGGKRGRVLGEEGVVEVAGLGDVAEALKKMDPECADMFLTGMRIGTG